MRGQIFRFGQALVDIHTSVKVPPEISAQIFETWKDCYNKPVTARMWISAHWRSATLFWENQRRSVSLGLLCHKIWDPKAISVCLGVWHPLILSRGKFGCRWLRSSKSFWLGRRTLLQHCEGLQHVTCFWFSCNSCIKTCVTLSLQVTNPMELERMKHGEIRPSWSFGRMDDRWHIRLALMWLEAWTRIRQISLAVFAPLDVELR